MKADWYPKADRTSQNFDEAAFPVGPIANGDDVGMKVLIHSTEGWGWPGYKGGANAPHLTLRVDLAKRTCTWRQHYRLSRYARALATGPGLRINDGGAHQIEIVGTSGWASPDNIDAPYHVEPVVPDLPGFVWDELVEFWLWDHEEWGVALELVPGGFVPWNRANRLTIEEWVPFSGLIAHQNAPLPNNHTDAGDVPGLTLLNKARTLAGVEIPMSTSGLGWTSMTVSGVRRVGPHVPSTSNPREITFRNNATADLLAAAMWLLHTGNGRKADRVYVSQWHGLRPENAGFGSSNSEHPKGVAMDVNWSWHPWEKTVGTTAYDAHMTSSTYKRFHAMCAAIVKSLGGSVQWCGQEWFNHQGLGYSRRYGNRDCMHWVVVGPPNWDKINADAARLRKWFQPPRTAGEIKKLQQILGLTPDGSWGHGSVDAMWKWEADHGLTPTGLPGTVAFWEAYSKEQKPDSNEGFPESTIKIVQTALNKVMGGDPKVGSLVPLALDGSLGPDTRKVVKRFQNLTGLKSDELPGAATQQKLDEVVGLNAGFTLADIRGAQQVAKLLGFYDGTVDGLRGSKTREALESLQRAAKGLGLYDGKIDGLPGTGTMDAARKMIESLNEPEPEPAPEPVPDPEPEPTPEPEPVESVEVHRISGSSRWATAVAARRWRSPAGFGAVIYADEAPSDAHVAIDLARRTGAILLPVSKNRLPAEIRDDLTALRPSWVAAVGGTTALPDSVIEDAARAAAGK